MDVPISLVSGVLSIRLIGDNRNMIGDISETEIPRYPKGDQAKVLEVCKAFRLSKYQKTLALRILAVSGIRHALATVREWGKG